VEDAEHSNREEFSRRKISPGCLASELSRNEILGAVSWLMGSAAERFTATKV
jgi:hypothetical protein